MNAKKLFGIFTITAAFAMNGRAQVQIYQFTTPITGYMTMGVWDANGPSGSRGSITVNFSSLSETIYLDPVAQTLRQVGTINLVPPNSNVITFQETQNVPGQFPNPPTNVSGSVTTYLTNDGGNLLSFDTGAQSATWNGTAYAVNGEVFAQGIPMSGSYSLTTGGQTYTGSFSYNLTQCAYFASTFNTFSTSNYPSSIQLSGFSNYPFDGLLTSGIIADVKATNGFEVQLRPGSVNVGPCSQYMEEFIWTASSVTATNVANAGVSITEQPQSEIVYGNNPASFNVTASGALPIGYQWSFNGTNIAGATASALTIPNVMQSNLGTYAVVVTNQFGTNTSTNVTLSMYPFIADPFQGAITYWGKSATFGVQVWGTGPLSYQWFDNGVAINGATNQSLTLTTIQATNAGLYSVVVTSALGSATNPPAQVVVEPAGVSVALYPGVTIDGVVGYKYIIQSTANLANTNSWVTVANLTLTNAIELWTDTNASSSVPGNSRRFYQVLPGL